MFADDETINTEETDISNNPFREENQETPEEETTEEKEAEEVPEEKPEGKWGFGKKDKKEAEKLKIALEDMNNKYLRLAADFDNFRKRTEQERENLLKYGAQETLTKLLVVLDTFERAQNSLKGIDDAQKVKESYDVAIKMLLDTLNKAGLEIIEAEGAEFDPNLHEAVAQTPTTEYPDNTVIAQMQTGYKLGDRVLRPALVNVAKNEE